MKLSKTNQFRQTLLDIKHSSERAAFLNRLEMSRALCYYFENGQCPDKSCREQFSLECLRWSRKYGNYYCRRCKKDWEKEYRKAKAFLERNK